MLNVMLAAAGLVAVAVGAYSRLIRSLPLSPALLGLLVGVLIGPVGLTVAEIPPADHEHVLETASRLLLGVALMGVALRYPRSEARSRIAPVALLLLAVMPAMAVSVSLLAGATMGLSLGLAAAVGAALTPTDPVLASSVVTSEPAERDIPARLRQLLSLESGANDGLAILLVLVATALAIDGSVAGELGLGLLEVVWGSALGAALGAAAGWLMHATGRHRDIQSTTVTLFALMLAFAALGTVALLGGNEVLAVFVAGLAYNRALIDPERISEAEIDVGLNQFLILPVFVLFGMVLPWQGWLELGWAGLAFALLVLLLRRLPWVLLLKRPLRLGLADAVWLGWFGPIGVATLFYLGFLHAHGVTDPVVWELGTLTVAASTLAHGMSAAPGRRLYARAAHAETDPHEEQQIPNKDGKELTLHAKVWMLNGSIQGLRNASDVGPGDLVLRDCGDSVDVGRVINDWGDVRWIDDLDADLLPEPKSTAADQQQPGPVQRVEHAPALLEALRRIEESQRTDGA